MDFWIIQHQCLLEMDNLLLSFIQISQKMYYDKYFNCLKYEPPEKDHEKASLITFLNCVIPKASLHKYYKLLLVYLKSF